MTASIIRVLFFGILLSAQLAFAHQENRSADFRLVVSGGLQGVHDDTSAFYRSKLFHLGSNSTGQSNFVIEDATLTFWRNKGFLFVSAHPLSASEIIALGRRRGVALKEGQISVLKSGALLGIDVSDGFMNPKPMSLSQKFRALGAVDECCLKYQIRQKGNTKVLALALRGQKTIPWPKSANKLKKVPGALGAIDNGKSKVLFVSRGIGATAAAFFLVDRLVASRPNTPAAYVDLGNALSGPAQFGGQSAASMKKLLLARNPVVLGAERYDLAANLAQKGILEGAPYVLAATGAGLPPTFRTIDIGRQRVQFSAIGGLSHGATALLSPDTNVLSIPESIGKAGQESSRNKSDIVLGLAPNKESAATASSSPFFDAVLALVPSEGGTLPAIDDMNLSPNYRRGLKPLAPLVRVSAGDITEVFFWVNKNGGVRRIRIRRHTILSESNVAADAYLALQETRRPSDATLKPLRAKYQGGPQKEVWTQKDLDDVLGGILLKSQKAEVAIIDSVPASTKITSEIPGPLAQALLERPGRALSIDVRGSYLKKILKLIKANLFSAQVSVVGATLDGPTLGQQGIVNSELYRLVASEKAYFAILSFLEQDLLFAYRPVMSSVLGKAMKFRKPIGVLRELRKSVIYEFQGLHDSYALIAQSPTVSEVVEDALVKGIGPSKLENFRVYHAGRAQPKIYWDIEDLHLGLSLASSNNIIQQWQERAKNKDINPEFELRDGGLKKEPFINILLRLKSSLGYILPNFETKLSASVKFYNSIKFDSNINNNLMTKPDSDRTKINLTFRVPMERILNIKPGQWVVSPMFRTVYQTQLWPMSFLTPLPENAWPDDWLPRVKNLRFFLGGSLDTLKKSEIIRLGAIASFDLTRDSFEESFDFGGELFGNYTFPLGMVWYQL